MKNLFFTLLILVSAGSVNAQFEGTLYWSIKTEITDPELKKRIEESKARANEPANLQRVKEMQGQMEDPKMKEMMEKNPQLRAQMERMLNMAQTGNTGPVFPTSLIIKMKNENTLTKTEGGMVDTEVLYLKEKGLPYLLNRQTKSYSRMLPTAERPTEVKVNKTEDTVKILEYTCTKYKVDVTSAGKTVTQTYWTTTDISDIDIKHLSRQRLQQDQPMVYPNIEGFPLRIEINYPEMKARMVLEVTELVRGQLKDSDFSVPADFKEVPPGAVR